MEEEELKEFHIKKKKRILGNVNFIGELLLAKVITKKVIDICNS